MNIKEVNRKLEENLGIFPKTESGIDLFSFYALSKHVKCHGEYEDYSCYRGSEVTDNGRGEPRYHEYEDRVYYDIRRDIVVDFCDSEASRLSYRNEYHYDPENDKLVLDTSLGASDSSIDFGKNYLLYYKCCKKDIPYFKPIKLEGNLTIDCEFNIYNGEEFIVSLEDIIDAVDNKDIYGREDVIELLKLTKGLTININDLPKAYVDYLKELKKLELLKIALITNDLKAAYNIYKEFETKKQLSL